MRNASKRELTLIAALKFYFTWSKPLISDWHGCVSKTSPKIFALKNSPKYFIGASEFLTRLAVPPRYILAGAKYSSLPASSSSSPRPSVCDGQSELHWVWYIHTCRFSIDTVNKFENSERTIFPSSRTTYQRKLYQVIIFKNLTIKLIFF